MQYSLTALKYGVFLPLGIVEGVGEVIVEALDKSPRKSGSKEIIIVYF